MTPILLLVNALVAILMVILILLQRNDPAAGGMFGGTGGGSQPVVRNPLARPTAFLAAVFLINCITIAYLTKGHENASTIMHAEQAGELTGVSNTIPDLPAPQVPGVSSTVSVSASAVVSPTK
ncbi:MAG TPA: preprotein translocase subunit SecG [Alphaproteobacteria bacterium]|nr:preprotein translocase subunit SecG [Alphaproteobacteria bacterium]